MLILLYSALLTMVIAVMALRSAVSLMRHPQYREGLEERFGKVRPDLAAAVAGKRVVWVHAVSVGEVLAASRLVTELGEALGDEWVVVVSTVTHTGQALARTKFGAERVFFTPIDFGFSVRAYLNAVKPAAIVLVESGVWPRMMHECEKRCIPVMVVNARVGDKSYKRAMKMRGMWARVLRRATLWLAQSDEDARRLVEMGVPADAVKVGGNLKYDVRAPKESRIAELIKEAAAGRPIVVGGSTLGEDPPEDSPLIHASASIDRDERPLLVLAPRHPERFSVVYSMAVEYPTTLATELLSGKPPERVDIVVLDTIGDLASVYSIADLAFIGGSLVKRGGHNPLEPAQFGVPVVIGPSFENFRGIVDAMRDAQGISIVGEDKLETISTRNVSSELSLALMDEMQRLLRDDEAAKAMGERGRKVFEEQQGATKRAVDAICSLVQTGMVKP